MFTDGYYTVEVEKYAERHYLASFKKKYKSNWDITWKALEGEFQRIERLVGINNFVEIIADCNGCLICKSEFRVAGTKESRKGSGNRCIIAVYKDKKVVRILLVYSKTDVKGSRETDWWQNLIKINYPEYRDCF